MLYLIESQNYYKIGYAVDVKSRMKSYFTHNPDFKLLDECNGDEKIEAILHNRLKHLRVKGEWFQKDPEVLSVWGFYKVICTEILSSEETLISAKESLKKIREEKSKDTKTIINQGEQISTLHSQIDDLLNANKSIANNVYELIELIKSERNKLKTYKSTLKDVLDIAIDRLTEEEIVAIEERNIVKINRDRNQTVI